MPLGRIRCGPAHGLLAQRCPRPTGHEGHDPLLCGLVAHRGGSGLRPCGATHVLGGGDFTDTGGPATRSEWRRLQRSTGGAASSPGQRSRGATVRRPAMRHSTAWLSGDSRRCGDLRRRRRAVSGGRLDVKTWWHNGLPEQRWHAASDHGSDAALRHSGQNDGEADEASDRGCRGGA
jgi:hypothetical protein